MRLVTIAAALVFCLSLVACGGEDPGAALPLEERVVGAAEAPGSEPDPVETPVTATGLEELEAELAGPNVYEEDLRAVEEAGFVSMIVNTRYFPSEPGGEHVPARLTLSRSCTNSNRTTERTPAPILAHDIGLRPCPETCAYEITE